MVFCLFSTLHTVTKFVSRIRMIFRCPRRRKTYQNSWDALKEVEFPYVLVSSYADSDI